MRSRTTLAAIVSGLVAGSQACDSCFGPINKVEHVRHAKRMQPDAYNATYGPTRGSLEWGQLNFLHTVSLSGHDTTRPLGVNETADARARPILMAGWKAI